MTGNCGLVFLSQFDFNGNYPKGKIRISDYIPEGDARWFSTKFSNLYLGGKTTKPDAVMAYTHFTWLALWLGRKN